MITKDTFKKFQIKYKEITDLIVWQDRVLKELSIKIYSVIIQLVFKIKEKPTVLFLAGPSRVWKTYFAKKVSKLLWDHYLYIPMSNLKTKWSLTTLIWAGPSYVWYENKGLIWNYVKNDKIKWPYVFIFDEIEKWHEDLQPFFLELLDIWQCTLLWWDVLDVRNSLIIFTSNLGSKKTKKEDIVKEIKKFFPPELYNRFWWEDWIFTFDKLRKKDYEMIFIKNIDYILEQLFEKLRIDTFLQDKIRDYILKKAKEIDLNNENISILQDKIVELFLLYFDENWLN